MLILELFLYISVDYSRKHKWIINPKGNRYRKIYIYLHNNVKIIHQRDNFINED